MKTTQRTSPNGSAKRAPKQAASLNPALLNEKREPAASKAAMTEDEIKAYGERQSRKLNSPLMVPDTGLVDDDSDENFAGFLAKVISKFCSPLMREVFMKLDDYKAAAFGEIVTAALEVSAWYQNRSLNLPFPSRVLSTGIIAGRRFKPGDLLMHFAMFLHDHRAVIRKQILDPLPLKVDKVELAEALVIAQYQMDRGAGGEEEIIWCEQENRLPEMVNVLNKLKADYYGKLLGDPNGESFCRAA